MVRRDREQTQLSKTMAHALRHAPWLYELELDDQGWVPVDALLSALRRRGHWQSLREEDLANMIARSEKRRYEMRDGRIRALYGHSLAGKLARTPAEPPAILYHGTSARTVPAILAQGLMSMARQYVHLSVDVAAARQVGARKEGQTVVLEIRAGEAYQSGVAFYRGNEMVWLADFIPPRFIATPDSQGGR